MVTCGSGGVGKTTTAAAAGGDGRRPPRRQGAGAHRRPGQAPGQRPRPRAVRQRRDARCPARPSPPPASSPGASCGRPCSTPRQSGTTSCAGTRPTPPPARPSWPTRSTRTSPASSSRATTTSPWSGSTRSTPSGRYDLIVVDTPPTRNAIDFLEAPERMADFFSQPAAALAHRARTAPGSSTTRRSPSTRSPTASSARSSCEDIAEFFLLFQTMYDGFVERAAGGDPHCSRTSARPSSWCPRSSRRRPRRPSSSSRRSTERKLHLGALVLNKVLPTDLFSPEAAKVAERLDRDAAPGRRRRGRPGRPTPSRSARVLDEVGESFLNYRVVATREAEEAAPARRRGRGRGHRALLRRRHPRPGRPAQHRRATCGEPCRRRPAGTGPRARPPLADAGGRGQRLRRHRGRRVRLGHQRAAHDRPGRRRVLPDPDGGRGGDAVRLLRRHARPWPRPDARAPLLPGHACAIPGSTRCSTPAWARPRCRARWPATWPSTSGSVACRWPRCWRRRWRWPRTAWSSTTSTAR